VGDDAVVQVGTTGFLLSLEQEGVDAGNGLFLDNAGVISVGDEGVQALLGATIFNNGTGPGNEGVIDAVDDAIQVQGDGFIENGAFGQIVSLEGDGIDIDSGVVINAGLIRSEGAGEAGIDVDAIEAEDGVLPSDRSLLVENTGIIEGEFGIFVDPLNLETQVVTNGGHISGLGGGAIDLGGGEDKVLAAAGAGFNGLVDGGADFDTLSFDFGLEAFASLTVFPGGVFRLATEELDGGGISFTNFESFVFVDDELDLATLKTQLPTSVVPLPASASLLIGGFALLGWMARRRRG
jgi:hypothetical protein